MTTRHRQLNLIIQRVPILPGNPFDPFGSGPTEGAPVKVWPGGRTRRCGASWRQALGS